MATVKKGVFVKWIGDSKHGDGKAMFVKDIDNIVLCGDKDVSELQKGTVIDIKIAEGNGKNKLLAFKVKEQPKRGAGGSGGGKRWGGGGGGNRGKEDPAKQRSIRMQHAQKVAVEAVLGAITAGVWKVPAAAKAEEFFLNKLDELSTFFFQRCDGEKLEALEKTAEELAADSKDTASDEDFGDEDFGGEESSEDEEFGDDFD